MKKFFVILGFVFLSSSLYAGERPNILGFELNEDTRSLEERLRSLHRYCFSYEYDMFPVINWENYIIEVPMVKKDVKPTRNLYYGCMSVAGISFLKFPLYGFSREDLNQEETPEKTSYHSYKYYAVGAIKVESEKGGYETVEQMELISAVRRKYNLKQDYCLIKEDKDGVQRKILVLTPEDESEAYKIAFVWDDIGSIFTRGRDYGFSMVLFNDFASSRLGENIIKLYGDDTGDTSVFRWLKSLSPHELEKYKKNDYYEYPAYGRDFGYFEKNFDYFLRTSYLIGKYLRE
jgi:hypothetical protein